EPACPCREAAVVRNVDRAGDVPRTECSSGSRVDDDGAPLDQRFNRVLRLARREPEAAKHAWPVPIDALHLREILRRLGLTREDRADERRLVLLGEADVEQLLVAQCALRHRAQRLATCAARAMAGPELHEIEIGRASCRERVEKPMGAVLLKTRDREEEE